MGGGVSRLERSSIQIAWGSIDSGRGLWTTAALKPHNNDCDSMLVMQQFLVIQDSRVIRVSLKNLKAMSGLGENWLHSTPLSEQHSLSIRRASLATGLEFIKVLTSHSKRLLEGGRGTFSLLI